MAETDTNPDSYSHFMYIGYGRYVTPEVFTNAGSIIDHILTRIMHESFEITNEHQILRSVFHVSN